MKKFFCSLVALYALVLPSMSNAAYPERPITLITGFAAGGTTDMIVRALAPELEKRLGQPIVIVNRGGGGGAIAVGEMLAKPADGYTVCVSNSTALTFEPHLKTMRYSYKDMAYLGSGGTFQEGFFCASEKPWKNYTEMVAWAKKENKPLTCASPAAFDTLLLKYLSAVEGITFRKVPVKSGGETVTQVLGGHVDFGYGGGIQASYVKSGKMTNLASTTTSRFIQFPDTPTLGESGHPLLEFDNPLAFYMSNMVPADIAKKFSDALVEAASTDFVQDVIGNKAGLDPTIMDAVTLSKSIEEAFTNYGNLVEKTK